MHAFELLHTLLSDAAVISVKRLPSLLDCVDAVIRRSPLSLTSVGHNLKGSAQVKNKIKQVDRLLGNALLYAERHGIYKVIAQRLIGDHTRICVLVDWSPCITQDNYILRASLLCISSSFVLYEEVHPVSQLNRTIIHTRFMKKLSNIIPLKVKPIIITDAGFQAAFLQIVLDLNWDFVNRVRSIMHFCYKYSNIWIPTARLKDEVTLEGKKFIGEIVLSKKHKVPCRAYVIKEIEKVENPYRKKNRIQKMENEYKRSYDESWVIVSSLENGEENINLIYLIYACRMKIEHEFRATKNTELGLGLSRSKTRCPARLEIILLIAMLSMFVLVITGVAAEKKGLQYEFQANTIKEFRVISVANLGKLVIQHASEMIDLEILEEVLKSVVEVII